MNNRLLVESIYESVINQIMEVGEVQPVDPAAVGMPVAAQTGPQGAVFDGTNGVATKKAQDNAKNGMQRVSDAFNPQGGEDGQQEEQGVSQNQEQQPVQPQVQQAQPQGQQPTIAQAQAPINESRLINELAYGIYLARKHRR